MLTYKLPKSEQVLDFLLSTNEFQEYEVMIFDLSASTGINLNINTRIIDPSNQREFETLKELQSTINNFCTQAAGKNLSINFQIKLKAPIYIRNNIDPYNEYSSFNINFYSVNYINSVSTSYMENIISPSIAPIQTWEKTINQLYTNWKTLYEVRTGIYF